MGNISPEPVEQTEVPEVVRIRGLSKRFVVRKDSSIKERIITFGRRGRRFREDFWALKDIDLDIRAGETIGLIGHNGSGKSTLLKAIGGIIDPTSGSVLQRGRIAALLELGAGFHPDLTGRENVYLNASVLGLSREETDARFDDIVAFASIGNFIDTQVKFYSSGMYVRLAFAVAVHTDPDVLLVDEVLAVGDEAFQRKCMDRIRLFQSQGRTIVLVSHSLGQISELCTRGVLLDAGSIVFDGHPAEAVSRFRDVLEDRRLREIKSLRTVDRASAAIVGVTAGAVGRGADEALMRGDDLEIDVRLSADNLDGPWVCGIQIDDPMGLRVFETGTDRNDVAMPRISSSGVVTFTLKATCFGGGRYFVNVVVIDGVGRTVSAEAQAASFTVVDDPRSSGALSLAVVATAATSG